MKGAIRCFAVALLAGIALQAQAAAAPSSCDAQLQKNKDLVVRFYNALAQGDTATLLALGRPDYRQHNPAFGDTIQGLADRIKERPAPAPGTPKVAPLKFLRIIAEGDYVVTLRRMGPKPGVEPTPQAEKANVDIFRVQDGKIAEHWDYQELFPRGSEPPKNNNGRF